MSLLEPPPPPPRRALPVLVVIGLLLVWNPLTLAIVTATSWPRLSRYGLAAWALLVLRVATVGLGLVGARWLIDRDPRGAHAAALSFLANAAIAVVLASTPFFLSNALPGTKWPTVAVTVVMNLALAWYSARRWLAMRAQD